MAALLVSIFGPLLLAAAINLIAAALTTGGRLQRGFGVALGVASMLPAWLVPADHSIFRALWTIGTFMGAARTADLARGRWSLGDRVLHVLSVVDSRRVVRVPRAFDLVALRHAIAWEALAGVAFLAVPYAGSFSGAAFWVWRWLFAVAFIYTLSAGAYHFLHFAYRAAGFVTPPLHIAPAAARSVQEFWGERWNRTVSTWLADTFFRPLARKRQAVLGVLAAFVVSALLHAYIAWVAVSLAQAGVMLAFFLLQAVVIALERALRVRAWRPTLGHAWTIGWLVSLSPLFSEPALRAFGV